MFSCLLLVVATVALTAADPSPCCANHRFMSNYYTVSGSFDSSGVHENNDGVVLYYDFDMKMTKTVSHDGDKIDIADYNNHMVYSIRDGVCYASMYNETMTRPCVDSDAQFEGTFVLGGRSKIMVNMWRKQTNVSATHQMMTKTQVTAKGCIPVSYSQYGVVDGVSYESTNFFTDVTEGAILAGAFDIPRECSHVMPSSAVVGRRSLPFEIVS